MVSCMNRRSEKRCGLLLCSFLILSLVIVTAVGCVAGPAGGNGEVEPPERAGTPPEGPFDATTGNIHDYMPDLLAGRAVSGYELLPCLENFTPETWAELNESYSRTVWWNPFWEALRDAAVSSGRSESDHAEQIWRNYYLGKALLVSDGAWTEGLVDLAMLQWDYDYALYSSTLRDFFTPEGETTLRRLLTGALIFYRDNPFSLWLAGSGGLSLEVYPVDFPFYVDLEEKNRESFLAESFGPGAVVEGGDLQVKYLNPYEGVYKLITIRTVKEGCSSGGVAVGDSEETLLERWQGKPLRKLDRISYDDEAWFGDGYDYAYAHSQAEGTKSVLFLVKNGIVCGLELIDGLDGTMYRGV